MDVIVESLVVGYCEVAEHGDHLRVEEVVEDGEDDDGHDSSRHGLVDGLLPGPEGRLCAEQVHPEDAVGNEFLDLFYSHFL